MKQYRNNLRCHFFIPRFCIIEFIVAIVNSFTKKNQKLYSADIIQVKKYGTKPISDTNSLTNATVRHRKNTVQITKERCLPKNKGLLVQRLADWHIDFYDIAMANEADYGFMIWDGKSRGTLNNTINLVAQNKKVLVYLSKQSKMVVIHSFDDLNALIEQCNPATRDMYHELFSHV